MKSLDELKAIQDKRIGEHNAKSVRVMVGMATCGIAAGAKPVFETFTNAVKQNNLSDIEVTQVGCLGLCQCEPLVEIIKGDEVITYVNMDADKAKEIAEKHLVGGNIVEEYTISNTGLV